MFIFFSISFISGCYKNDLLIPLGVYYDSNNTFVYIAKADLYGVSNVLKEDLYSTTGLDLPLST